MKHGLRRFSNFLSPQSLIVKCWLAEAAVWTHLAPNSRTPLRASLSCTFQIDPMQVHTALWHPFDSRASCKYWHSSYGLCLSQPRHPDIDIPASYQSHWSSPELDSEPRWHDGGAWVTPKGSPSWNIRLPCWWWSWQFQSGLSTCSCGVASCRVGLSCSRLRRGPCVYVAAGYLPARSSFGKSTRGSWIGAPSGSRGVAGSGGIGLPYSPQGIGLSVEGRPYLAFWWLYSIDFLLNVLLIFQALRESCKWTRNFQLLFQSDLILGRQQQANSIVEQSGKWIPHREIFKCCMLDPGSCMPARTCWLFVEQKQAKRIDLWFHRLTAGWPKTCTLDSSHACRQPPGNFQVEI